MVTSLLTSQAEKGLGSLLKARRQRRAVRTGTTAWRQHHDCRDATTAPHGHLVQTLVYNDADQRVYDVEVFPAGANEPHVRIPAIDAGGSRNIPWDDFHRVRLDGIDAPPMTIRYTLDDRRWERTENGKPRRSKEGT